MLRIIAAFSLGILLTWITLGGLNTYSAYELSINYFCGEANGYNRGYNSGYQAGTDNATEEYKHSLWHYEEQSKCLYAENQRMHQILIDSGLYELEFKVVNESDNLSIILESYKLKE